METLIHADIFFFIATIATVIFTVLISIALCYLISILRSVKQATDIIKDKVETVNENLEAIQKKVVESSIFNFIFSKKNTKSKIKKVTKNSR